MSPSYRDMDCSSKLVAALAPIVLIFAPSVWKSIVNKYNARLLSSYIDASHFLCDGTELLQEGYRKYRGTIFKVPMMSRWLLIVSGSQMIEDIRTASEDQLSAEHAFRELFHSDLIFGPELHANRYLNDVLKMPLTRNIGATFADIHDEMVTAFNHHVSFNENEWVTITPYPTVEDIVSKTTNRMLVGLPLCREPAYLELIKTFTINFGKTTHILNMFPRFLRPIVFRFLPEMPRDIEKGMKHLVPLFTARLEQEAKYGKRWSGKPNDAISWLIDYSNQEMPIEERIREMVLRILVINFSTIHNATISFTNVLFDLAAHPEYVQPMRDEIEAILHEEGWSKAAVGKLRKLDSFIKESMRLSAFNAIVMQRKVMTDFTFSNGVTVPAGSLLAAPLLATHSDPDNFSDPGTFDGFRFDKLRDQEGMTDKHQMVSLDVNYLSFGYGRHACPGRFFVVNELKTMLAHVLMNYDVQMADGRERPANRVFGFSLFPDPTAQVMLRKRV